MRFGGPPTDGLADCQVVLTDPLTFTHQSAALTNRHHRPDELKLIGAVLLLGVLAEELGPPRSLRRGFHLLHTSPAAPQTVIVFPSKSGR